MIVRWATEEYNVKKYVVQRSADGSNFVDVGEVVSNNGAGSYSYADQSPVSDYSFYRVLAVDNSLKTLTSNVVRVVLESAGGIRANVRLFPNPSTNHTVQVQFNQAKIGNYRVRLVSSFGQQLYAGSIRLNDTNGVQMINLPSSVRPGNYMLSVIGDDGTTNTQMLMVQ